MFTIMLRGLRARKARLVLTLVSVLIGVAGIAGAFMLTDSVSSAFTDIFTEANAGIDVAIARKGSQDVSPRDIGSIDRNSLRIPNSVLETVRSVPGVKAAEGSVAGTAQVYDRSGKPIGGQGPPTFGFSWTTTPDLTPLSIASGRAPRGPHETALDRLTASKAKAHIGDTVRIVFDNGRRSERFRVTGFVRFGATDATQGVTYAVFDLPTARRVFNAGDRFDGVGVQAGGGVTQRELARRIRDVLPPGIEAVTGKEQTADQLAVIEKGIGFFRSAMLAIAIITLFVGAFVIFNTFSIIVAQRTRELGLLRALGATRAQIMIGVLSESFVIGLFSSVVGIGAGVGVANGLRSVLSAFDVELPKSGIELHTRTIVICLVTGVVVTMFAALIPAIRSSRITALEALQDESTGRVRIRPLMLIIGVLVAIGGSAAIAISVTTGSAGYQSRLAGIGAGFALLIIGVAMMAPIFVRPLLILLGAPMRIATTGRIAISNAGRSPRRTAATATALMIGIGLASFMAIFTESASHSVDKSIDSTIGADLLLSNAARGSYLPDSVLDQVRSARGVASAVPLRSSSATIRRNASAKWINAFVNAVPAASRSKAIILTMASGSASLRPNTVVIAKSQAAKLKVTTGDTVQIRIPRGRPQTVRIGGIFSNSGNANVLMSNQTHDTLYPPSARLAATILVNASEGTSTSALRKRLKRSLHASSPFVLIQDQGDIKDEVRGQLNQLFGLLTALLTLALIIALIGIVNTLALSVFERTREIGLLRAVGMSRSQTWVMVCIEAILISLIGATLGLALGAGLGTAVAVALKSQGLELAVPTGFVVVLIIVGILAGLFASILPAFRAARLNVLNAISTE